jgi:hypothetical protein
MAAISEEPYDFDRIYGHDAFEEAERRRLHHQLRTAVEAHARSGGQQRWSCSVGRLQDTALEGDVSRTRLALRRRGKTSWAARWSDCRLLFMAERGGGQG